MLMAVLVVHCFMCAFVIRLLVHAGQVAGTPVAAWLVDMAAAQQAVGQQQAAVASLQQALTYMALPPVDDNSRAASSSSSSSRDAGAAAAGGAASGALRSDAGAAGEEDAAVARLKVMAQVRGGDRHISAGSHSIFMLCLLLAVRLCMF
jgi:hypothetical protein